MTECETVLFVSPGPDISNPASGEGTRLKHLSHELAERGWRVLALVSRETAGTRPDWITRQFTYKQWSLSNLTDVNPSFVRVLHEVLSTESVDVVHLSNGVCTARMLTLLESDTIVVYAAQNLEADHARDFVDPELPAYKRLLGPRLIPAVEWMAVHCADGVTTVSEKDRQRFIDHYDIDEEKIAAVPSGTMEVDWSGLKSPEAVRKHLGVGDGPLAVFHGYFGHPPNREAAELIDRRIAPAVHEEDGDVEFLLVGKNPPDVSTPGVHAVGFVDDLLSVLNAADVAILPILHGGGTKTKLYDYVSLALPIVATKKAIDGIDIESRHHGLITSDIDCQFVSNILTLIHDAELRLEIRNNLTELAKRWRWNNSADQLDVAYRQFR